MVLPGLLWTAPEFVRNEETEAFGSQKGDVYSFAIILYEIYGKNGPFGDTHLTAKGMYATRTLPPRVCTHHSSHRQRSVRNTHLTAKGLYASRTSPPNVCTSHAPHRQRFVRALTLWLLIHQHQWSVRARYCWQSTASLWSDLISAQVIVVYDVDQLTAHCLS